MEKISELQTQLTSAGHVRNELETQLTQVLGELQEKAAWMEGYQKEVEGERQSKTHVLEYQRRCVEEMKETRKEMTEKMDQGQLMAFLETQISQIENLVRKYCCICTGCYNMH